MSCSQPSSQGHSGKAATCEAHIIPGCGHSPYFEQAAFFNRWRRFSHATAKEEIVVPGQPANSHSRLRHGVQPLLHPSPRQPASLPEKRPPISGAMQIVSEARSGKSITMPDLPGFFTEMDRTGNWTPVPIRVSLAQPGGPVEEGFFPRLSLREIEAGLKAGNAARCGVHLEPRRGTRRRAPTIPTATCSRSCATSADHGAGIPGGVVFDLHANVSRKMIDNISVFVGYLENPHNDIYERARSSTRAARSTPAGSPPARCTASRRTC